jgi:hypothetical protein
MDMERDIREITSLMVLPRLDDGTVPFGVEPHLARALPHRSEVRWIRISHPVAHRRRKGRLWSMTAMIFVVGS